ncbi:MAG TPA: EAL domain-containing protein, partial [Solirubrobacteraceae bacterium]
MQPLRNGKLSSEQRLSLLVKTQREIAGASAGLEAVMHLIAERSQAITGADGAMVNLVQGDMLHTRAVTGIARTARGARRPVSTSVGRFAIQSGLPLLVEDAPNDPRINQELRSRIGDQSLICVPLFHGAEVIGTLNVMSRSKAHRLDEDDRQTLEILSVVLSGAVSRASEFEARRGQARAFGRFRALFDSASIGILRIDGECRVLEVNPALEEMLGATAAELERLPFTDCLAPAQRRQAQSRFDDLISGRRDSFQLETRCQRRDGNLVWTLLRGVRESDQDQAQPSVVMMAENVSERKRAERELVRQAELNEYQALHDPLTGLPNRTLFKDRTEHAIRQAERNVNRLAVVLMDLDRFKEVNDTLGHAAGDQLLAKVGSRLRHAVRASDTIARLGGDEFALLATDLADPEDVVAVIERIRTALDRPIHIQSLPLVVEGSIGVAMFPDHGDGAELLIQRADVAMYEAKRDNTSHSYYDAASHETDLSRLTLVSELRRGIDRRELVLHYQPKLGIEDGVVRSVEALVRWAHPVRGLLRPDEFVPVAQETSLIGPLTLQVLDEALRQACSWRRQGVELAVSVNLSMRNLLDCEFPRQLAGLLARWDTRPEMLGLEVTESSMAANPARANAVLCELSKLGVRLSIDDFGTGYSSLSYLRELPLDEIKIDRSFVINMGSEASDVAIVSATIDLGRNLGLEVVAEGVESRAIWDQLRHLGCKVAQGFYISRPLASEQLVDWVKRRGTEKFVAVPVSA